MNYIELIKRFDMLFFKRRILLQKSAADIGLYSGQMPVMKYILNHSSCSQVEIAKALQLSTASVAISTKRLQKAGMLTKVVDEANLRSKKLTATDKGREKTEACHKLFGEFDERLFSGFDEQELTVLKEYLDRLIKNISDEQDKTDNLKFCHMLALENQFKDSQKNNKKGAEK
jgi:DNA-binding MarR family transcriptional regulator